MSVQRLVSTLVLSALIVAPAAASAAPPVKTDVCHYDANTGEYRVLSINAHALAPHLAHGDVVAGTYFADLDGDGYGDANGATDPCPNPGFVANADDCNDAVATINPAASETCGDNIDNNCSGQVDEGCLTCPCFGAADIDQALVEFNALGSQTWDDYRIPCYDVRYPYSFAYNYISLHFYAKRKSPYRHFDRNFYNWGVNDQAHPAYCVDSKAVNGAFQYQTQIFITYSEYAQCQNLLRQWITDNNVPCTVVQ